MICSLFGCKSKNVLGCSIGLRSFHNGFNLKMNVNGMYYHFTTPGMTEMQLHIDPRCGQTTSLVCMNGLCMGCYIYELINSWMILKIFHRAAEELRHEFLDMHYNYMKSPKATSYDTHLLYTHKPFLNSKMFHPYLHTAYNVELLKWPCNLVVLSKYTNIACLCSNI